MYMWRSLDTGQGRDGQNLFSRREGLALAPTVALDPFPESFTIFLDSSAQVCFLSVYLKHPM